MKSNGKLNIEFEHENWILDLMFLVDVTSYLNFKCMSSK